MLDNRADYDLQAHILQRCKMHEKSNAACRYRFDSMKPRRKVEMRRRATAESTEADRRRNASPLD